MEKDNMEPDNIEKETVEYIALSELSEFENHPFRTPEVDDPEMKRLIESIREKGVITPGIVRPKKNGEGYEIISGHRRKLACKTLGIETMPVIVKKNCEDDEATILMVTSNVQRRGTRKSEEIKAYSLMYEKMKHQGKIDKDDTKGSKSTREAVAKIAGVSGSVIRRYIELSHLSKEFLEMLDDKRLKPSIGVVISSLPKNDRATVQKVLMKDKNSRVSFNQANELKKISNDGTLSEEKVKEVLAFKNNDKRISSMRITFTLEEQAKYFGGETDPQQIKNKLLSMLEGGLKG